MTAYRLWVSDDRCTFVRVWVESVEVTTMGERDPEIIPGATVVEVAHRAHPSHTWGPPITLTEEKV